MECEKIILQSRFLSCLHVFQLLESANEIWYVFQGKTPANNEGKDSAKAEPEACKEPAFLAVEN